MDFLSNECHSCISFDTLHTYLDVARYAFDIDVHNLSKTNTELTSFLMTD